MLRRAIPLLLGGLLLMAAVVCPGFQSALHAQKDKDLDKLKEVLGKPETPYDFWKLLQLELKLGSREIAAGYLKGLLDKKPADAELLRIIDDVGITPVLQLRNIPVWSPVKKMNDEALRNTETLIDLVIKANASRFKDAGRIRDLIQQLKATKEERAYARGELYKLGAEAVPYLIEAYVSAPDANERLLVRQTLERLSADTIPPLLATLESDNVALKLDVLDILRNSHLRYGKQIVPYLWYPASAKDQGELVRAKATRILSDILDLPTSKLPSAKAALSREAEKYYHHEYAFADPKAVAVWRWDGKKLVKGWPDAPTVTQPQAEEYYGQHFARQALTLDNSYQPPQVTFLSLALANSPGSPGVTDLLAKANVDLLIEVLDKALKEKRTSVILPVIKAMSDRAEVRAKRPLSRAEPGLVRALYHPEPAVQLAAAEALLRIPGPPIPRTASTIVDILGRMLSPATAVRAGPKVLLAITDEAWRNRVRTSVIETGSEPVSVSTGVDAIKQLKSSTEFHAAVIESALPYPGLAHLLAQLKADRDTAGVPILLVAVPETRAAAAAAVQYQALKKRRESLLKDTTSYRDEVRDLDKAEQEELAEIEKSRFRIREDQLTAIKAVEDKYADARKVVDNRHRAEVTLLTRLTNSERALLERYRRIKALREAAQDEILVSTQKTSLEDIRFPVIELLSHRIADEAEKYDAEVEVRETSLRRFLARYPGVEVVHASLVVDGKALNRALQARIGDDGIKMTAAEKTEAAERAMVWLAKLADGDPAGYDVKPVAPRILDAIRQGRLSPTGQLAAIRATTRLPGAAAQTELAMATQQPKLAPGIRTAAAAGLIDHVQRHGLLLTGGQVDALRATAAQPGVDGGLKLKLDQLSGAIRSREPGTGSALRDYRFTPVAPLPPPKDKDKDKEMEKEKEKD